MATLSYCLFTVLVLVEERPGGDDWPIILKSPLDGTECPYKELVSFGTWLLLHKLFVSKAIKETIKF